MRILHLLFTKGFGGLERYAVAQAHRVAERGHDVAFWRRAKSPADEAARSLPGERLAPIKYVDLPVMAKIRRAAKQADVVHVHASADLGLAVPALLGLPTRLIFSNYMQAPAPKKDFYHRFEYRRVDAMVVASAGLKTNMADNLPIDPARIAVIPYGLDVHRFDPAAVAKGALRSRYDIPADAPVVGVLSRLEPLKGQRDTIDAVPAVLAAFPDAWIVLAGDETPESGGTYEPTLRRRAEELGVAHRVVFTGRVDETAPVLADFTIYLLPSHSETFSLGCLEAMAMGLPVIGTDAGGTPEMLDYGGAGVLVPPKESGPLAEAIIGLLGDPARRETLGAAARTKVADVYDAEPVTDKLLALYRGD
jgi:glycosyltransferase involved in cell wall biosynthesis